MLLIDRGCCKPGIPPAMCRSCKGCCGCARVCAVTRATCNCVLLHIQVVFFLFGCCYGASTFITAASVYISAYKEVPSGECKLLVKLCAWVSSTTCCLVLVHAQCSSGYTLAVHLLRCSSAAGCSFPCSFLWVRRALGEWCMPAPSARQ